LLPPDVIYFKAKYTKFDFGWGSCWGSSQRFQTLAEVMRTHVKRTVSRCFSALRQLRQIRRSVPPATFQSLVVALELSRLDYGNAVLVGLPAYLVRRLQSVLNAAAQLIYRMRSADHVKQARAWVASCHRRSCLLSLAARPGADRVQGRRSNVQNFTRKCAAVSGITCLCRR